MAELRIDKVGARDIDLLVAGKIAANPEFARPFLGSRETGSCCCWRTMWPR